MVPSSLRRIFRFDTYSTDLVFSSLFGKTTEQTNLLLVLVFCFVFFFFLLLTTLCKSVSGTTNLPRFHSFAGHLRTAYSPDSPVKLYARIFKTWVCHAVPLLLRAAIHWSLTVINSTPN